MSKGQSGSRFQRSSDSRSLPLVDTDVWECTAEDCTIWMRNDMTFDSEPSCPVCGSPMEQSQRQLPKLI